LFFGHVAFLRQKGIALRLLFGIPGLGQILGQVGFRLGYLGKISGQVGFRLPDQGLISFQVCFGLPQAGFEGPRVDGDEQLIFGHILPFGKVDLPKLPFDQGPDGHRGIGFHFSDDPQLYRNILLDRRRDGDGGRGARFLPRLVIPGTRYQQAYQEESRAQE